MSPFCAIWLTLYAIQGTNYALVHGDNSFATTRQSAYIQTLSGQLCSQSEPTSDYFPAHNFATRPVLDPILRNVPISFIADTDSTDYILDTSANRFIINDACLFLKLNSRLTKVKGINGADTSALGDGTINLTLSSDANQVTELHNIPAVYVPSSPYNLLSP